MSGTTGSGSDAASTEKLAERLLQSTLGAFEMLGIYVGDRLGWYRALAEHGPLTATELAARTATAARYVREWLELQASTGIASADDVDDGARRRYSLSPAAKEVLTDASSLNYLAPLGRILAAPAKVLPELLSAYRSGTGVSWAELGDDAREAQADLNRPWFELRLGEALRSTSDLDEVLSRDAAHVIDMACGAGWSSIAIARAYPLARVHGYDIDAPSIEMATRNAAAAGLADRVSFSVADGAEIHPAEKYDAGFIFEALHDVPRPVEMLAALRESVRDDGAVVVMDEAVGERFTADADDVDRLMYGFSMFVCLPDGLSSPGSAGTGTVMRPSTLERYARDAGFSGSTVLPIEGFSLFRFYQLVR